MTIQGKTDIECLSVYDPAIGAYHEILVSDYILQLQSLGLTAEEINVKLAKLRTEKVSNLVSIGIDEETAQSTVLSKIPDLTSNE